MCSASGDENNPEISSWTTLISTQRSFDPIFVFLVALQGFVHLAEAYGTGESKPFAEDDWAQIGCNQFDEDWVWYPTFSALLISRNIRPPLIRIGKTPNKKNTSTARANFGAVGPLVASFGQVIVPNFYEAYRNIIEHKHGKNPNDWPPVWDFARVVRNAMSHGGRINFDNRSTKTVTWRQLRYQVADNGREILHSDLGIGDFFSLILEMEEHL